MKVILLKDVKGKGKKDEIIEVSTGYANNYLIKNNLAVPETKRSKEVLDIKLATIEEEEKKLINECKNIAKSLTSITLEFQVKTGTEDKVFGSISTKQIALELSRLGYDIDKKKIILEYPLDSLGTHNVRIDLHKKVPATVKVLLKK